MIFFQKCFIRRESDSLVTLLVIYRQIIAKRTIDSRNEVRDAFSDVAKQSVPISKCRGCAAALFYIGLVIIGATFLNPLIVIEFIFSTRESDEVVSLKHGNVQNCVIDNVLTKLSSQIATSPIVSQK